MLVFLSELVSQFFEALLVICSLLSSEIVLSLGIFQDFVHFGVQSFVRIFRRLELLLALSKALNHVVENKVARRGFSELCLQALDLD